MSVDLSNLSPADNQMHAYVGCVK